MPTAPNRRLGRFLSALSCGAAKDTAEGWVDERAPASGGFTVDSTIGWPEGIPAPKYVHVPRFTMETVRGQGEALAHLQEEGYVVIKDVLDARECSDALEMLWLELEQAPGVSRSDPNSWGNDQTFGNNWGHSDFLWHVRGLPKVRKVWELAHHTDELLVSYDGASIYRPWGINPEWNVPAMGLHTDQRHHDGIPDGYIQGFVNLIRTTEASGGNVIIPKSHKYVDDLDEVRANMKEGQSFYQAVAEQRPEVFSSVITAHVEAGDVFLWLDTTIHCRAGGTGVGPTDPTLIRAAVYVTMSPKSKATPQTLDEREQAVIGNHGNGHTAHHPMVTGMSGRENKDLAILRDGAPEWGGLESLTPAQLALVRGSPVS